MAEPPPPAPRVHPAAVQRHLERRLRPSPQAPWLHTEVARRMVERLDAIRMQPASIIDWWSTLGGSAEPLAQRYPAAQLTAVEPAALLPFLTAAPTPWWRRWSTRRKPIEQAADDASLAPADLLWANMVLHWVDDLPAMLHRWREALATDGFLMCSGFGPDTLRELRALYAELDWPAPASAFVDMHDIGDAFVQAGFADPVMDMEQITLTWDSAEALLSELRSLGGNTDMHRFGGLRGRGWHRRLITLLQERLADQEGRLRLTFEVVYGHAFKPLPRIKATEHTQISLDSMRQMIRQRGKPPGDPRV